MAPHIAIVPLVVAKDETARDVYIYQGCIVPENVSEESLGHLLEGGFIESLEVAELAEEVLTIPEGDPTIEWTAKQLKAYAGTLSIELGDARNKDDILAVIVAASAK